ncbi:hypothetical protein [Brevundimonas bacteroides]|uniref:hypothetical protein n=1 Tax=Brevundimonas bacteroides TaxID=74311 RepID=UPI00049536B5|nr:hypothetical protein [Brevundimonas bacteroides]
MSVLAFFAITALAPAVQDGAGQLRVYQPPVVRPFEPPSNFGRVQAEGDGGGDTRRAPIVAPVVVEAYARSYEYTPSTADSAYDRGVDDAEAAMDARMGPLDGLWRLVDQEGRAVGRLALSDPGPDRSVEGALCLSDGSGGLIPLVQIERDASRLVFGAAGSQLDLTASPAGWAGVITGDGRRRPVRLTR